MFFSGYQTHFVINFLFFFLAKKTQALFAFYFFALWEARFAQPLYGSAGCFDVFPILVVLSGSRWLLAPMYGVSEGGRRCTVVRGAVLNRTYGNTKTYIFRYFYYW